MSFNKDTNRFEGYIYLIENLINGKQYIGQTTTTIKHRWGQHTTHIKGHHNMPVVFAINKYGKENFTIVEVQKYEADTKENLLILLNEAEIYYIAKYNTLSPIGYNVTLGGNNVSSSLAKPVDAYTTDGEFLRSFDSASEAERFYEVPDGSVTDCCMGNILTTGNKKYTFRYKGEPFDKFDVFHYKRSRYIYKFDLDGNFIQKYSNATLAGMDIEDSCENVGSRISAVIDNPNKTAYGFYWSSTGSFDFDIVNYRNRMPVDQYDFNGNMLNTHKSTSDACEFIGKTIESVSQILDVCRGKSSHAYGYIWRFKDDPFDLYSIPVKLAKIKVDKYTIDGVFITTYDSFQDALRAMGKDVDQGCNLRRGCLGISPIVFGFVWRFYGEPFNKYPVYKNRGGSDKPVDQYTFDGIFVNTYPSAAEGGRVVGLTNGAQVTQVCKGNRYSAGGYLWRYHDVPLDSFTVIPKKASPKKGQPINVYDLDNNFLYTKESSKVIAKELNCCADTIRKKCNGGGNHVYNNLKFYYSYDSEQPDISKVTEPIYSYLKE